MCVCTQMHMCVYDACVMGVGWGQWGGGGDGKSKSCVYVLYASILKYLSLFSIFIHTQRLYNFCALLPPPPPPPPILSGA